MTTTQMPVGPFVGSTFQLTPPWSNFLSPLTAISWDTTSLSVNLDGTTPITLYSTGSVAIGTAALTTTATDGFLYIPTCAGTPTGVPTTHTGRAAMVYDTTNNKLYVYNGAWKGVVLA